jgi:choline kinase
MEAIMLAAGIGARLSQNDKKYLPKCLLRFDGQSLLARHIDILRSAGIKKLTLVVGYREEDIKAELAAIDATDFVETITNPDFRDGSILSLFCAAKAMRSGTEILFMDADVLYHADLIQRLAASTENSHILYDTGYEPGDEPVMLCLVNGKIVEFKKNVNIDSDIRGEWPGFVKWSAVAASQIADIIDGILAEGAVKQPYEDAFREYMLSAEEASVQCDDITGLPWIEIDFPEDLERARDVILPALKR